MNLLTSKVPRALENKTKLLGYELGDLLLIFLYLATTNLVFGTTTLKIPVVWGGTFGLAGILYFIKRDKPDGYLQDLGQFYRTPSIYTAACSDTEYKPYLLKENQERTYETSKTPI